MNANQTKVRFRRRGKSLGTTERDVEIAGAGRGGGKEKNLDKSVRTRQIGKER